MLLVLLQLAVASPSIGGSVAGTVSVGPAPLRIEGPKHDRDVILYLTSVGSEGSLADARAEMDQASLIFVPHVLPIQRGTTVTFLNSDNDQHNVYFLFDESGETLDIGTWGPGVSVDHRFEEAGEVIVLCKLHLEMAAYIVVVDSPHFVRATLDPSSREVDFEISGVPDGVYELHAWHKKLQQKGGPTRVSVANGGRSEAAIALATR